ncbi:PD-(D/E)XK motif protein [Aquirufa regiilacus]|uniref:PD-(D/E)XK motif protein n=1 Tax=Aquirufa regiilacus TaxID=3024868 RepID=A0ABU3TSZ3_9BACT|nr:PD-(D/E)XK motif protein [Aquirufa sp. LEOWEIH-7C]MDU0808967.1 PD-(D/E)XK motif protein [Aquirufa sp. LEOWEIH-7C]
MNSIFNVFQDLKKQSIDLDESFRVISVPFIKNHKIGISKTQQPIFFIKCCDTEDVKYIDINLEYISIQYGRMCQLKIDNNKIEEDVYTIISLKTDSIELQEYFLEVVFLLVKKISENPVLKGLKVEIDALINLFNKFSAPPVKTIQGLWAELLIIEQSSDPDYLIGSWHNSKSDKFDFNDGLDKLEIKSTSKNRRIHSFSIEQLNPNKSSCLIIASIFVIETGIGKNIFDLVDLIEKKIINKELSFRLHEIIAQTLGKDFEKSFEIFYDYKFATDSIKYYYSEFIPSIKLSDIPTKLTNVRFDCDLTDIVYLKCCKNKSLLHNSLFNSN